MTDEEFAAKVAELTGSLDNPDAAVKEHDGFTFGERVRVLEGDDDEGVYEGDEGTVIIEALGLAELGSARTAVFLVVDGLIDPVEITGLEVEPV
jgi:hypothetical protein